MDEQIIQALDTDETTNITTIGRKSSQPRRIEIWFRRVDGRTYITGTPGKRDWYANLVAHPQFTFHLKESVTADLAATARPILDSAERRHILTQPCMSWYHAQVATIEDLIANSPLVEVTFAQP